MKPVISVILPVYRVGRWIDRCLASLLSQSLAQLEFIFVDDCGNDDSISRVEKIAAKDNRIQIIHNDSNLGSGPSRNKAIENAHGDYLAFFDPDDTADSSFFEELYEAAEHAGFPDIVMGRQCMVWGNGTVLDTSLCLQLKEQTRGSFALYYDFVRDLQACIFKREFVEGHGIRFGSGSFGDDTTFLLQASYFATSLELVATKGCYRYLQHEASLMNTVGKSSVRQMPQALSEQIDFLLAQGETNQAAHRYISSRLRYKLACIQELSSFDKQSVWVRHTYEALSMQAQRMPNRVWIWQENKRAALFVATGKNLVKPRVWPREREDCKRHYSNRFLRQAYLQAFQNETLSDKLILIEPYNGNSPDGNSFHVLRELADNSRFSDFSLIYAAAPEKLDLFKAFLAHYRLLDRVHLVSKASLDYVRALACAKYIIYDAFSSNWLIKREGQVFFELWHGTPIKSIGRYTRDYWGYGQHMLSQADFLLAPGPDYHEELCEAYMAAPLMSNTKVIRADYPRNEALYTAQNIDALRMPYGSPRSLYIFLPTYRMDDAGPAVERSRQLQALLDKIDEELHDDECMLVKLHYLDVGSISFEHLRHVRAFPLDQALYDFLAGCDVLVSDYSSVMIDFARSGGRVVMFNDDEEGFLAYQGGTVKSRTLPFARVGTVAELVRELRSTEPHSYEPCFESYSDCAKLGHTERLLSQVLFRENEFPVEQVQGAGKTWALFCPGSSTLSKGPEHICLALESLKGPAGQLAYVALDMPFVRKNRLFCDSLPPEVHRLTCSFAEGVPRFCISAFVGKNPIKRPLAALKKEQLHNYYALEAQRFLGEGTWFKHIVCELDAHEYLLLAFGHASCKKSLIVKREVFEKTNAYFIQELAHLYDEFVCEDEALIEDVRSLVGSDCELTLGS